MVEIRSMATQHDHINGIDELETSISDGAHPSTPRVDTLERKIQGLTANVKLLVEQN